MAGIAASLGIAGSANLPAADLFSAKGPVIAKLRDVGIEGLIKALSDKNRQSGFKT